MTSVVQLPTPSMAAGINVADPYATAQRLVDHVYTINGIRTLHFWQGEFYEWRGACFVVLPLNDVRTWVYEALSAIQVRKRNVDEIIDALRAVVNLSDRIKAPTWLIDRDDAPAPSEMIALANVLLHAPTRVPYRHKPDFFSLNALPFNYDADAPRPAAWLDFLDQLFGDDEVSVQLLCEWFGYCLLPRFEQHKALALIGPKRAGKGTILRVLTSVLGPDNVVSPGLSSLASPFGMACLVGKTLAVCSDARLSSRADMAVIAENLLRLTGEDDITIERKYRDPITIRPTVRLAFAANAPPAFADASSALPGRIMPLQLTQSFYGREDHALIERLELELPGIFNWALSGLDSLNERGHFELPDESSDLIDELDELAAPVRRFVSERCEIDPSAREPVRDVYEAWKTWCHERGRERPGTEQIFGRDLHAAFPFIKVRRPRIDGDPVRHYAGVRLIRDPR